VLWRNPRRGTLVVLTADVFLDTQSIDLPNWHLRQLLRPTMHIARRIQIMAIETP
jgi:hypothetical protein